MVTRKRTWRGDLRKPAAEESVDIKRGMSFRTFKAGAPEVPETGQEAEIHIDPGSPEGDRTSVSISASGSTHPLYTLLNQLNDRLRSERESTRQAVSEPTFRASQGELIEAIERSLGASAGLLTHLSDTTEQYREEVSTYPINSPDSREAYYSNQLQYRTRPRGFQIETYMPGHIRNSLPASLMAVAQQYLLRDRRAITGIAERLAMPSQRGGLPRFASIMLSQEFYFCAVFMGTTSALVCMFDVEGGHIGDRAVDQRRRTHDAEGYALSAVAMLRMR